MSEPQQSFDNHAKMVPLYHYVLGFAIVAVIGFAFYRLLGDFSVDRVAFLVLAIATLLTAMFARVFALGVQDRVIRLEERLRLERLLNGTVRDRIPELTTDQLVALRFASDEEVPELAARVIDERMVDRKAIKQLIRAWRADHHRI